ncbi:hypothetical protein N7481_002551 [Penicillium waksmanii]|uniref:uncharacterized protein n=1 Tax=Penicillium waksmanii TaxID=69791 RepID=UPI0025491AE3|nr:uncharacterized protein N7481_002551 [Penicillium waksmanii]KAJ5995574.1 hypothetical protein N7481_002551 [Penicillium waksmanii]
MNWWKKPQSGFHSAGKLVWRVWVGFWKFLRSSFCGVINALRNCLEPICRCLCSKPCLIFSAIILLLFLVIGVPIVVVKKHLIPPSVPKGWEARYDKEYKTWHYLNPAAGKDQWYNPKWKAPAVPDGWELQWDIQYKIWYYKNLPTGHVQCAHPEWVAPAVPAGWEALWSPTSNKCTTTDKYYTSGQHRASGRSNRYMG